MEIIKCSCGEDALPSNWSVEGVGRLWYCFNCQKYLDHTGQYQPYRAVEGKFQLELQRLNS